MKYPRNLFSNQHFFQDCIRAKTNMQNYFISLSFSHQSGINCLLPNLIRNFRRRDNLTSFLFSLARSSLLYNRGLVPRIFLSTSEWASERVNEQACASDKRNTQPYSPLPIQFISLRMYVVHTLSYSLSHTRLTSQTRTRRERTRQIDCWRTARREWLIPRDYTHMLLFLSLLSHWIGTNQGLKRKFRY